MLSFEHSGLKSLDKILQEGPQDLSSGTTHTLCVYLSLRHITMHVTKSPRPSPLDLHSASLTLIKLDGGQGLRMRLVGLEVMRMILIKVISFLHLLILFS